MESKQTGAEVGGRLRSERLRGLTLLVVDDDPLNTMVNRRLLELAGAEVGCAENGAEAIDMLGTTRFDAVLMDLEMGVMDGYEATRRIRAGEAGADRSGVPIVAVTAHVSTSHLDRAIRSGASFCLTKPFNAEKLYRQIEAATAV